MPRGTSNRNFGISSRLELSDSSKDIYRLNQRSTTRELEESANNFIDTNYVDFTMERTVVKAIVCSVQSGPYELKDVRIGAMMDNEIAVRMVATGVCHTDFACTNVNHGKWSNSYRVASGIC